MNKYNKINAINSLGIKKCGVVILETKMIKQMVPDYQMGNAGKRLMKLTKSKRKKWMKSLTKNVWDD